MHDMFEDLIDPFLVVSANELAKLKAGMFTKQKEYESDQLEYTAPEILLTCPTLTLTLPVR